MRRRTHRRQAERPALAADTVAILLGGWGAHPPPGVPHERGFGGGFLELYDVDGPARLWREHEAHLRRVARSWRWEPGMVLPDGRRAFWAEAEALGGAGHA